MSRPRARAAPALGLRLSARPSPATSRVRVVRSRWSSSRWRAGRKKDRPQLAAALAVCRAGGATLVIAKLDRLARNVAFVSNLMESGVEFIAADMPAVNRLTVHILAAVAEEEARLISARTKAALAAAKARGVQLGNPRLLARDPAVSANGNAVQVENAQRRAAAVLPYIEGARRAGAATLAEIAEALMARGVPAPRGGQRWAPAQVRRVMLAAIPVN